MTSLLIKLGSIWVLGSLVISFPLALYDALIHSIPGSEWLILNALFCMVLTVHVKHSVIMDKINKSEDQE